MAYHVSKTEFCKLVQEAIAELPTPFDQYMEEVAIEVRDRPTRKQLQDMELDEDDLLLGLYQGHPLTERSVEAGPSLPDIIFIFQEAIEEVSNTRNDLVEQVRTTVLHEIGHHFGMSEDHLDDLGYG